MDEWVKTALAKWPDVPALFGWLGLSRRGHWLIRGERISHPRIIDTIARNYGVDAHGRWYFQNGPQRGYVALEYAPLVLRVQADETLVAHTGTPVEQAAALYLGNGSAAVLDTRQGPGLIDGADLAWVVDRLKIGPRAISDDDLAAALAQSSGERTALTLDALSGDLPVYRCDVGALETRLGFVRDPQPRDDD